MASTTPLTPRDQLDRIVKLVRRAFRFWWVAFGVVAFGGVATLGVLKIRKLNYRSETVILFQEGLRWNYLGGDSGDAGQRLGQRLKETVLARSTLQRIIKDMNLYADTVDALGMGEAVEEMRKAITFKINEGETFVLTYDGDDPEIVQKVTSTLADTLIEQNKNLRSEQAEIAKGFLESERKRNEDELKLKETELAKFLQQHPEFAQEMATNGGTGAAARAKKQPDAVVEAGADTTLLAMVREEERLRQQLAAPLAPVVSRERPQDPRLVQAKADAEERLGAARRDLADKRAHFTEAYPEVQTALAQVKAMEAEYKKTIDALAASDAQKATEVVEIEPQAADRAALEARLNQVRDEITAYKRKNAGGAPNTVAGSSAPKVVPPTATDAAQRIVNLETNWARLNRELIEARERFRQLDDKEFVASMAASSATSGNAGQMVVVDPAFKPSKPIGPGRKRLLLIGLLVSMVLGGFIALGCAVLDDRLYDRADIEHLALGSVLISVPRLGAKAARRAG